MKFSAIFVGALATIVSAAPAKVEEEKRSGAFGAGFGGQAFGVGANAFQLAAPIAFGQAGVGNLFDFGLAGAFNQFNVLNPNIAFLLGNNGFQFNSLFSLLDFGFAADVFAPLFAVPAGNFIDVQSILGVNNLLVMQWLLNNFGQAFFIDSGFGGFGAQLLPTLNFAGLDVAGLGLNSQFAIDSSLLDINSFNQIGNPFLTGGLDAFSVFDFVNLGIGNFGGFQGGFNAGFNGFGGILKE